MEASSPPQQTCCFCYSSKKASKKKSKADRVPLDLHEIEWGKNDEILSDMSTFSAQEQEKRYKKAKEKEKEIQQEAKKVMNWVKQASSRMDVSSIEKVINEPK
ncbi:PREDICTED: uncharacterized protein LOC104603909 [Nelumbo nucifera]|uniref:Uncharacterized protein LOC104603909 n=2 Tax=Nelumbo nucifera TaxID=4432 RepID=A0A1U8AFN1_NELNU|nr:PREDICTED: uncharacterized protein LOC104603909 [Nelumbo nucifera]DAD36416.1 TPA_asm: hypothetical protein HUJ06_007057 [Nelumbo nucifera]